MGADPVDITRLQRVEEECATVTGPARGRFRRTTANQLRRVSAQCRDMRAEVAFGHGGDRMRAHDRVAVDPVDQAVRSACEEMTEDAVTSEARLAADNGPTIDPGAFGQRLHRGDEVPGVRGTVEGGTDLEVQDLGAVRNEARADLPHQCVDLGRPKRAGVSRDAEGVEVADLLRLRHVEKQAHSHARARQRRQRVRRPGEIVGDEDVSRRTGHASATPEGLERARQRRRVARVVCQVRACRHRFPGGA